MESEQQSENSLHTIAIILLCCGAVKMLHLLGVITVEGESVLHLLFWKFSSNPNRKVGRRLCFHCCLSVSKLLKKNDLDYSCGNVRYVVFNCYCEVNKCQKLRLLNFFSIGGDLHVLK